MSDTDIQFSALTASFTLKGGDSITREVKERTTCIVTIQFLDENGSLFTPDSIEYVLYDKFSGTERLSGSLAVNYSVDLEINPEYNTILNTLNRYEISILQILFKIGTYQSYQTYWWKILNLAHVV